MKQRIRFCQTSDHVRIAHAVSGHGPPLVRTTNWLSHLERDWESPVWAHWFEALSRGQTLVRYDARGTGLSDRRVDALCLEGWVRDLEAVVDELELEQFALLGFCQGGATAVSYAARHPERVSKLILCNSYPRGAMTDGTQPEAECRARALASMIDVGWDSDAEAFRQLFANLLLPAGTLAQQRWIAGVQRDTASANTASRIWEAIHSVDVREAAEQLTVPTLVFHVLGNAMVPFEAGRELATLIPDARFVPLEGDNHLLQEDDPGWSSFIEEVRDFLETRADASLSDAERSALSDLTPREEEVLEWLARGLSNDEIAGRLFIAPKTVRNHVTRIYAKLDVDSRARAVVLARDAGL